MPGLFHLIFKNLINILRMNYSQEKNKARDGLETMLITPETANYFMTLNFPNRPISKRAVDEYARRMKLGKWVHNGESIKFDNLGRLIDGQHRLKAVIQSGVTIKTDVRFGIMPDAKNSMDQGLKRQADGAFKIEGIPNYTNAAAICRGVMSWRNGSKVKATLLMNEEVIEFYHENPIIEHMASVSAHYYTACRKVIARSEIGILMFLFSEASTLKMAEAFFEDVGNGYSAKTNCVQLLVNRLIGDKLSNTRKTPPEVRRALIIKAWNNWVGERSLKQLKYSIEEPFPEIKSIYK